MKSEKIASLFVYFYANLLKRAEITFLINAVEVLKKRPPYLLKTFLTFIKPPVLLCKKKKCHIFALNL